MAANYSETHGSRSVLLNGFRSKTILAGLLKKVGFNSKTLEEEHGSKHDMISSMSIGASKGFMHRAVRSACQISVRSI